MRRLISALFGLAALGGCASMGFLDVLSVFGEASEIQACRDRYDREEQPWAYAACEDRGH